MSEIFPPLQSGSIAQYDYEIQTRYRSDIVEFLNNSEQVYTDLPTPRMAWVIKLSLLTSTEIATLRAFWEAQNGRFGTFSFLDQSTGTVWPTCAFLEDAFPITQPDETQWTGDLTVYSVARLS